MVTSFDISQEITLIDMLTALKSSLKHRRKHVLRSLQLYRDQALDFFSDVRSSTAHPIENKSFLV